MVQAVLKTLCVDQQRNARCGYVADAPLNRPLGANVKPEYAKFLELFADMALGETGSSQIEALAAVAASQ